MKKDDLKKNYYRMYVHRVCHDGMTEQFSMFDILYPLFIVSGITFILYVLMRYYDFKRKIKGENH